MFEYVEKCVWCHGKGEYKQVFTVGCGGGYYSSMGRCEHCTPKDGSGWRGRGYVYKGTNEIVPESVINQMKNAGLID